MPAGSPATELLPYLLTFSHGPFGPRYGSTDQRAAGPGRHFTPVTVSFHQELVDAQFLGQLILESITHDSCQWNHPPWFGSVAGAAAYLVWLTGADP